MEKREETLKEALIRNEEETGRWTKFEEDNKQAIENLESFGKKLTLDVLVPIGSKAFIPGYLKHTNEVFISHFGGIFSKCSSFQAQNICNQRIKLAKVQLDKLEKERELFQNKLEVPRNDGALPTEDQHEIIEEYDEDQEKLWREEHKRRVREYKQKEKEENLMEKEKTPEDIMQMLDELELMEELDQELDKLEVQDDDTLEKLMIGELKPPPEKRRISHYSQNDIILGNDKTTEILNKKEETVMQKIYAKYKSSNLPVLDLPATNNNVIPNTDDFVNNSQDSEDSLSDDIPQEVIELERNTAHLNKTDRIKAFKKKTKEVEESIENFKIKDVDDLDKKINLFEVRNYLLDYLDILDEDTDIENTSEIETDNLKSTTKNKKRKKISFAIEDQIAFIDNTQSVESMSKSQKEYKRDIIKLDPELILQEENNKCTEHVGDRRKPTILEQVEKECKYVSENQSHEDFNLIDKILGSETSKQKTLYIEFNHSCNVFIPPDCKTENNSLYKEIGSPADIYRIYLIEPQSESHNSEPLKDQSRNSSNAYEDLRVQFFSPQTPNQMKSLIEQTNGSEDIHKKSILKNKDAVEKEVHLEEKRKKKLRENLDGFEKILGEVVENVIKEPDPLPNENFIDSHLPRKRISRFKQIRNNLVSK